MSLQGKFSQQIHGAMPAFLQKKLDSNADFALPNKGSMQTFPPPKNPEDVASGTKKNPWLIFVSRLFL